MSEAAVPAVLHGSTIAGDVKQDLMQELGTISKLVVASLAVWRLTQVVHCDLGYGRPSGLVGSRLEGFLYGRAIDYLCWVSVWISAQTAVWVACGFAGVMLNWLMLAGAGRLCDQIAGSRSLRWRSRKQGLEVLRVLL